MRRIGTPTRPIDWQARTDGSAQYAGDLRLPGMQVGGVLRSPHPHARIVAIDARDARAVSGVTAILTADDLPDRTYLDYGAASSDRYPLARDVVRHVGEPIAIVAAHSPEAVTAALDAIKVRYRVLPAAVTTEQALSPGAPLVHENVTGNVVAEVHEEFGDVAAGREQAVHRVTGRYASPRQTHAIMEPHTVVAHWVEAAQKLKIWAPSQAPRALQSDLAHVFALTPEQVHLNEVAIGGDFGSRVDISHLEALAAALSMRTGTPVRLSHDRVAELAFVKSRVDWDMELSMGADADGRITHLSADYIGDNGAYNLAGPSEVIYGSIALGAVYRSTGYEVHGRCIYTNRQPTSSFRGAGAYAPLYGVEILADELADELGMDPIDFRMRNAVSTAGETGITGWNVKSSRLLECLATVRREIDWDNKRKDGGHGRGVGVAAVIHVTGLRREGMVESGAAVDILSNGRVRLRSGCGDPGTGQKTMLAQVVAEVLGVGLDRIDVLTTDTDRTPHDTGAGASRGTFVSGHAVEKAARTAADALRQLAAEKLSCPPSEVGLEDGNAAHGDERLPIEDLVAFSDDGVDGELRIETDYVGDFEDGGYGGYGDVSATYSFAAQAVEIDVDLETGAVGVVQVVAAHDSGRILNPLTARGQVEGGIVMGLGAALSEELIYDDGRLVNTAFVDYPIPRAADAPPIRVFFVGDDDPVGPYGAKGLAEISLLPTAAAVVNAVSHALGRRVSQVPITPDKVVSALTGGDPPLPRTPLWRRPGRWWIAVMRWAYPRGLHAVLRKLSARFAQPSGAGTIDEVVFPKDAGEAVELLGTRKDAAPMAGGVDLLVSRSQGISAPSVVVDLTGCAALAEVRRDDTGGVSIGAMVTLAELQRATDVPHALRQTAAEIASPQIRNVATVAGNLVQEKRCWFYRNGFECYKRSGPTAPCYAVLGDHRFSHAVVDAHRCQAVTPSDIATTLLALDAVVHTQRRDGGRQLTIDRLYNGPGENVLASDEVILRLAVPADAARRTTAFRKLRLSQGGFSVVAAAASLEYDDQARLETCRVVVGGVAPTPYRATYVEDALIGRALSTGLAAEASLLWAQDAHPLRDNAWKLRAGAGLIRGALVAAAGLED